MYWELKGVEQSMKIRLGILILTLLLVVCTNAQIIGPAGDTDEFIAETIGSLDKSNLLRQALERGQRGDGVHHEWMDGMKAANIKQAAFVFSFQWNGISISALEPKKVLLLRHYYRYDSLVDDETVLRRIESDGLLRKLRCAAEAKARRFMEDVLAQKKPAVGTVYINLLDDKRLPLMADLPDIDYTK